MLRIYKNCFQTFYMDLSVILLYSYTTWTLMKHLEKKSRWKLHKNAVCCFEQVLEVAPHKTASCTATCLPLQKLSSKMNKAS